MPTPGQGGGTPARSKCGGPPERTEGRRGRARGPAAQMAWAGKTSSEGGGGDGERLKHGRRKCEVNLFVKLSV